MNEQYVRALFLLAGIEIISIHETPNEYWPRVDTYRKLRDNSPWWLVQVHAGVIKVGWRKRVLHIDWLNTALRTYNITSDDVTKADYMIHASNYSKAVEYLTAWEREYVKHVYEKQHSSTSEGKEE